MTRLAYDMSSYIKTALLAGKDEVDGHRVMFEGEEVLVNSVAYGYENVTNMMLRTMREVGLQPRNCLLVFEGMQSKSRRLMIDSAYKAKRDKRPPEFYAVFQELRDYLEAEWMAMGAIPVKQDYVEGDDTLAWLAQESEEDLIIATRDGDMGALNTEGTNAHGAKITTWNDGLFGAIKLDGELFSHPPKYVTLYKALVGDKSDNIPGAKGFGPKSFQKLAEKFGYDGLDELMEMLTNRSLGPIHGLAEDDKLAKLLVANEADVIRSWALARMYPSWINTMAHPLQIKAGKVEELNPARDSRLHEFFGQTRLITASNYAEALLFFQEELKRTDEPTFDIETSSADESDAWLAAQGNPDGVDQIGSKLTGFSWTFGPNMQYTFYVSVDHANTDNIRMSQAREFIESAFGKPIVIQNTMFELGVLGMAHDEGGMAWRDLWEHYGARGFIPNVLDTKFEASYVDENNRLGLKERSLSTLGYQQVSYDEVTQLEGWEDEMLPGGREMNRETFPPEETNKAWLRKRYKMNELPAQHVLAYGADDTICTSALHNYYKLVMQLEHTWQVYLDVEIDAAYQHVKNFLDGMTFSLEKCKELEDIDEITYNAAWAVVRAYLMKHGWAGTVPPIYTSDLTLAQIKEAYRIVTGAADMGEDDEDESEPEDAEEDVAASYYAEPEQPVVKDPFLSTRVRTPSKLVVLLRELGHETFAGMVQACLDGEAEKFTAWVRESFTGEPLFKAGNKQMTKLLYEVMGLPIRVRGKVTKKMQAKGITEGNPKGDVLALEYALRDSDDEQHAVIDGLKLMQMVKTRRSLYYSKYPYFIHWLTGKIHPGHNQCQTNTRRASEMKPNKQQLPKHPKITGQPSRFRETIVPHKPNAVIVSMDFMSQELRVIADYSKDANMVACFVGNDKKDMHALTGASILQWREKQADWSYKIFTEVLDDENHPMYKKVKEHRNLGKKTNFTTEFGAMAPKLAMTMLVTEAEAQVFIDAKEKAFPGVRVWKNTVIAEAKSVGYVRTMLGAMRHLAPAFTSLDSWIKSKAERQAVNFKVQSSSAEMTKLAEGRMWVEGLFFDFDAVCYGPFHDEVVASVVVDDRFLDFLQRMHGCMVQPYAGMGIPVESSVSFGASFGDQNEVGDRPTAEVVIPVLEKLYGKAG